LAHWAGLEGAGTGMAADEMTAWQEDHVDFCVKTNLARPCFLQLAVLLHDALGLCSFIKRIVYNTRYIT